MTKYHPAGYSSGYSDSRKFARRIFGWNILLLIQKRITHYGQNDSYSTKWHTKGFQNVKLVSHYSKSVSRKNSECLDFVFVQVTPIVQKRHNFYFMLHKIKKRLLFHKMAWQGLPKY